MSDKQVVGIVEEIVLEGRRDVRATAVFDTGAKMTSVDVRLAAKAMLGPIVKTTKVSNPSLKMQVRRPVVEAAIRVMDRRFRCLANIQDREHMTFPVIIGRNIINGNFVVDTKKNHDLYERRVKEKNDRGKQAQV